MYKDEIPHIGLSSEYDAGSKPSFDALFPHKELKNEEESLYWSDTQM